MAESLARRAHAILKSLVAVEPALRDAEAVRLCEGNAELLKRVRDLLGALARTDAFLEAPIGKTMREAVRSSDAPALPNIAGFTILRLIGVGGMAAVYEAMQELPRRRVALKVLRRSMAGTAALRRFEFETEVLAKLRHPGIAQIYEAGTFDDGAGAIPYFAMEYIDGARTLTQYAQEAKLDLPARLALLASVCDAVQHGHQNGVIHRDLKPGNVLVDAHGSARVIDFGIARSIGEHGPAGQTTVGQILGTLNAMSPEQCAPNGNVDARTDVYALGVMLYELLCQQPPHELSTLPIPEAIRVISEVPPRRPSSIDPRLRGDAEAIVLKAIEKDPERRYATVAAMGSDIRRYLDHQVIEARPPTIFYQLRLFARRNRAFVAASIVVCLALLTVSIVSVVSAMRVRDELQARIAAERVATSERDLAVWKSYLASIASAFAAHSSGDPVSVAHVLDEAPERWRGWEWRWLRGLTNQSVQTATAHSVNVMSMAVDQAQERLTTVARDGSVSVRSLQRLELVLHQLPRSEPVAFAAVLPGGERVGLVLRDGRSVIRSISQQAADLVLDPTYGECRFIAAVDPNTVVLAADGALLRWSLADGHVVRVPVTEGELGGMQVSADGRWLATWSGTRVVLRDTATLAVQQQWSESLEIGCVLVREDLDRVVVGLAAGQVAVRTLRESEEIQRLAMRDRVPLVRSVDLDAAGAALLIGQGNGAITLVELPSTKSGGVFLGHLDAIAGVRFVNGGTKFVSSSWDGTVRMWNAALSAVENSTVTKVHDDRVMSVAFDATPTPERGAHVLSASVDGTSRVNPLDVDGDELVIRHHQAELYDAAFSPDGRLIASAGLDGRVVLSDATTGELVAILEGHTDGVWSLSFSPDGSLLATAGDDKTIRIWDVRARVTTQTLVGHEDRVINVAFSHDGTRIASASRDTTVRIWQLDAPTRPRVLYGHAWDVFAVVWSRDDRELYTGSRDQTVRVWSTEDCTELAVIPDARQFITCLALSPDGTRLIGGTWYGSLVLIDPIRREYIASLKVVTGTIRGVAFSPDGHRIAIGASDGTVRLLDDRQIEERQRKPAVDSGS